MEYTIKTKFDVGDIVIGFPKHIPELIKIDRIDIRFERFGKDNPHFTSYKVYYLATPIDKSNNYCQTSYDESSLYTKEELKEYMNNFLEKIN